MKSQYKNGNYKKSQNFRNEKYSIWTENFTKLSNVLGNAKEKVSETREGNWNYLNGSTERKKKTSYKMNRISVSCRTMPNAQTYT